MTAKTATGLRSTTHSISRFANQPMKCIIKMTIAEKEQHHMREQILKSNWSVRQTEKKVKITLAAYGENQKSKKKMKEIDSNELILQLENLKMDLEHHLGTKVSIQHHTNGKGSIKIDYYSLDDFDRLYQILTS